MRRVSRAARLGSRLASVALLALGMLAASVSPAGAQLVPKPVAIRAAAGDGYDRVVFEFAGGLPAEIDVDPVSVLISDPAGMVVPVAGQARLRVRFAMVDWFFPPVGGPVAAGTVTEVRLVDSFEGIVHYGIGMRWNASYRVFTLSGPPRVVIDIDHAVLPTVNATAGTIYAIDGAGALRWYRHADGEGGAYRWAIPNFGAVIGDGFATLSRLVSGGNGVLYGVDGAGNLRWYRHGDPAGGSGNWVVANFGAVVGTGWGGLRDVVADGFGDLYALRNDGTLLWFFHRGRANGANVWDSGSGTVVASGLDACTKLFAGGPGILYCVRDGGKLQWWRHVGAPEDLGRWIGGNIVGTGWDRLVDVWSGGQGVIYGVDSGGQLHWYRHLGSEVGSEDWQVAAFGNVIGDGWSTVTTLRTGGLQSS